MSHSLSDTIAAIATPPGEGALAVVRISGKRALAVADAVFRSPSGLKPSSATSHTVHYGHVHRDGQVIDEVLLTVFRAPRSFTTEDTVEISGHGGSLVSGLLLGAVLAAGARAAEPGEFTQRAFLHGRIDLTQAEAVVDLIHARTELALESAHRQLAGRLSDSIRAVQRLLLQNLAHIEAHLDFPEEDITPHSQAELISRLGTGGDLLAELLRTAREGRVLREGLRTAILGRPNAGKSSLMNRLLGHDRTIVSPIPGTTRDTVEETANLGGVPVTLIDTAGLRATDDPVEAEGVRRSESAAREADLILHVIDGSEPLTADDAVQLERLRNRPHLTLLNKGDRPVLAQLPEGLEFIRISSLTGDGMDDLKAAVRRFVGSGQQQWSPSAVAISARHADALRRTLENAQRAGVALQENAGLELAAFELRTALSAIGEIVGETTTDDLLDSIFSQFCLGK